MIGINFMKLINLKKKSGFTLTELMTSFFIIALMTGLFLANYQQGERQSDLMLTSQNLISNIRLTQAYSLGLFEYDQSYPYSGWGVYFDTNDSGKYIIFADISETQEYQEGEANEDKGGRIINISDGIEIVELEVVDKNGGISSVDKLNIVFLPPDPRTYINKKYIENKRAIITLKQKNNEEEKKVKVNFAGLIETYN